SFLVVARCLVATVRRLVEFWLDQWKCRRWKKIERGRGDWYCFGRTTIVGREGAADGCLRWLGWLVFVRCWLEIGKRRAGGFSLFGGVVWTVMDGDGRGIGRGVVRWVWLRKRENGSVD
ncbi:hypothetical protein HAX54_027291, partial [Datura stramonium]|nr:hypothetical protein [Datura stramonium]